MILLLIQARPSLGDTPVYPVTIVGWVALALSIGALGMWWFRSGQFYQRQKDTGERVGNIEATQAADHEVLEKTQREIFRVLDQHETLLQRIGEAREAADKSREDYIDLGTRITLLLTEMRAEAAERDTKVRERLVALETRLRLLNGPRARSSGEHDAS